MKMDKLKNVITLTMGQSPSSESYNEIGEGLPFFQGKADFGKITPTVRMYCSQPSKIAIKNDILMSVRAPVGDVNISNVECCIGRGLASLRANEQVLYYKYLYYVLNFKKEQIANMGTGSTFKAINKGILEEVEIPVPNLEEQNQIVDVLDKAQELIDKRKEQIQECDELIKSQFIEMFGDSTINPNGYEVKRIDEIAELIKGITYSPEQVASEGMIVLRSSNIKGSDFDLQDLVKITKKINESKWVKENDILMCNRNGSAKLVGKVAKIPKLDEAMTFGTFMTIVRSNYYEYLFAFFHTEAFRRQIQFQTAVAINQISLPLLASVNVPLPPIELQNQFAKFVQQVDKLKFEMQQSLVELENNFNSLMQRAFKGELF